MSARTRGTRRAFQVGLCILLAVGAFPAPPAGGDDVISRPERVGSFQRFPKQVAARHGITDFKAALDTQGPHGSLIGNPDRDVVYQIWTLANHPVYSHHTLIAEWSLADMRLRRTLMVPRLVIRANSSNGIEWVHTLDRRNQRLILEFGHYTVNSTDPFGLIVLDLKTFTHTEKQFPPGLRILEKFNAVFGMEYDEEADRLMILAAGIDNNPASSGNTVVLVGWNNADIRAPGPLPGPPSMLGPRYVRNCRRDPINLVFSPRLSPIMIAKGPDLESTDRDRDEKTWIVFPCFSTPYSFNDVIIRISREGLFDVTAREEKAVPAPASIAHWAMDTKRGRMFLLNGTQEVVAWVYEVSTNAFIGLIELTPKGDTSAASVALGVDEVSGRLYAVGLGFGLMITEADQDPVPQADIYDIGEPRIGSLVNVVVDHRRDRVMFIRGSGGPGSWLDEYEIWRVPRPLPPQKPQDRDELTSQVEEAAGKTIAEYGGIASAYGLRILGAGGLGGVLPSNGNEYVGGAYMGANVKCGFRNREIAIGAIPETELSESIVDARADSIRLDDNTVKDFGQPSRCEPYYIYAGPVPQIFPQVLRDNLFFTSMFGKIDKVGESSGLGGQLRQLGVTEALDELAGVNLSKPSEQTFNESTAPRTRWDYVPADCAAEHYPRDKAGQNAERFAGPTSVDCRTPAQVSAKAEGQLAAVVGNVGDGLAIRVGRASSWTKVRLDTEEGVVSEATARLENVQIGPVTIGFIESTARSVAHGRMGTAETEEFEPRIGLVRGGAITGCEVRCSVDELLPQLNNLLSGRAEVRRVKPDSRLQRGTPGGYEAGIIKSDKQQSSDNALSGDSSREVSALELIVYNDNPSIGRARQLVQFAGVRATSNYGIKVIDAGVPCPDCEPPPFVPPPEGPGEPQIVTVDRPGPARTVTRRVPVYLEPAGYRVLLANPRAAGAVFTVWLLLFSPALVYFRRRRFKTLQ